MTLPDDIMSNLGSLHAPSSTVAEDRSWWRTRFTPGSIAGIVTARKRYRCDGHLTDVKHFIEPGEKYVANALPPDHPDISNSGWWHLRVCKDCCPAEFAEAVKA